MKKSNSSVQLLLQISVQFELVMPASLIRPVEKTTTDSEARFTKLLSIGEKKSAEQMKKNVSRFWTRTQKSSTIWDKWVVFRSTNPIFLMKWVRWRHNFTLFLFCFHLSIHLKSEKFSERFWDHLWEVVASRGFQFFRQFRTTSPYITISSDEALI